MLIRVVATDENYPAARGVRVGDRIEQMYEKYGYEEESNDKYFYTVSYEGYMIFTVENDIITKIHTPLIMRS